MEVKSITEQKSLLTTLSPGKRARLRRLLFDYGPGNGTLMLLPIDQGIEHGPRDFFPNPASKDPEYQFSLAAEAGYSAIACQIGLATRYYPDYAGQVPLILKVNGKTDVPPSDDAFSSTNASVEDAVRLGADAVGYTLYVGSPRQDVDLHQLKGVREDCERYGMPLVVWAYPRGRDIDKKGGQVSFYAIDYAARMAMEMGADIVKLNFPKFDPEKDKDQPAPYNEMDVTPEEAVRQIVESVGPRARGPLRRVEDGRRDRPRPHEDDHGSGRLRRDLRPQCLAARKEPGARDHRRRSRRRCSPTFDAFRRHAGTDRDNHRSGGLGVLLACAPAAGAATVQIGSSLSPTPPTAVATPDSYTQVTTLTQGQVSTAPPSTGRSSHGRRWAGWARGSASAWSLRSAEPTSAGSALARRSTSARPVRRARSR